MVRTKSFLSKTNRSTLKILKQVFEIKDLPNPWQNSIEIAICTGVPMILGFIFKQPLWSAIGVLGSFAYLYVANETYYRRAKKMAIIVLGFTVTVFLSTLVAPHPFLLVIILGLIGAIATFFFDVLNIPSPAAVFFVLVYLSTADMPLGEGTLFQRTLIVFISASFSWIVSMAAAPFDTHSPETRAVKNMFMSLADYADVIGEDNTVKVRNRTVNSINEAEETLLTAHIPWKDSQIFDKLSLLYEEANLLFIELLDLSYDKDGKLPKEIGKMIRELGNNIKVKKIKAINSISTPQEEFNRILLIISKENQGNYYNLLKIMKGIQEIINTPLEHIEYKLKRRKISKKNQIKESLNRNSIVLNRAARYGFILSIASAVSYSVPFYKPYWISLSCGTVMLGSTIIGTFNRTIERFVGTLIGLGLAAFVLILKPKGYELIIIVMLLSAMMQFIIKRNYAIAAIFITANAIIIAESKSHFLSPGIYFRARISDVVIGSVIGLVGTIILGQHSASVRLKNVVIKSLESQSKVFEILAFSKGNKNKDAGAKALEKMKINLTNFKTTYTTALGEIGDNKEWLADMLPIVLSLEYISYLLEQKFITKGYLDILKDDLTKLLKGYETMISTIGNNKPINPKEIPILNEIPKICREINILQETFSKISIQ